MDEEQINYYVNLPHTITLKKWTDEFESYYVANIPELPGCKTHGFTIKEALENIKDAKIGWICVALERNMKINIPENQSLVVKILDEYSKEEKQELFRAQEKLRKIIDNFYEKHKDVTFIFDKKK